MLETIWDVFETVLIRFGTCLKRCWNGCFTCLKYVWNSLKRVWNIVWNNSRRVWNFVETCVTRIETCLTRVETCLTLVSKQCWDLIEFVLKPSETILKMCWKLLVTASISFLDGVALRKCFKPLWECFTLDWSCLIHYWHVFSKFAWTVLETLRNCVETCLTFVAL